MTPFVARNDWSAVDPPPVGGWRPTRTVSVVIPAYQCQASLDLALAALSQQTYPAHLLEVLVVDDASQPPLELPKLRPDSCRLLRVADGWGRANALHHGACAASGEILHWLDADMLVYPEHVEAQARWHHRLSYAVTMGYKRFVDAPWPTPDQVADACAAGEADRLFAGHPSEPHDYVERTIAGTNGLRDADHLAFLVHVGATAALPRELYQAAGGLDTALRLGEDTELGYRLAQAGAVFIPEPAARSWHLGPSHMMRHQRALQRYNRPFLAARMPQPRWLRRAGGRGEVPLVEVVVPAAGQPLERVRAAVDSVLAADQPDLRVALVGPWPELTADRVPPLADPLLELRLVAASYRGDPRVRLVEQAPTSAFPAPYQLRLAPGHALAPPAVRRLVEYADSERLGLVRAGAGATLWRTAAVSRAWLVRRDRDPESQDSPDHPGKPDDHDELDGWDGDPRLADLVARVYGAGALPAGRVGVVDLSGFPPEQLAGGSAGALRAGGWVPRSVEVAGFRSLARAAGVVMALAARRAWHRLHRPRAR